MPTPIPLTRRHRDPPPIRPQEASEERRARQLAFLAELAELNMRAARAAADRIDDAEPETDQAEAATLSLARATRAVTTIFTIENRIADGERSAPLQPHDPRRTLLRDALHSLVNPEPDPARRTALRRRLDQAIDDALLADLDDDLPLADTAIVIARGLGLHLDLATVSDELLGMPTRPRHRPQDTS